MGKITDLRNIIKFRSHQEKVLKAFDNGARKILLRWSRRAGKSVLAWNILIKEAMVNPGVYWFCFNEYGTAKRDIWEAMTKEGLKFLDMIPTEMVKRMNVQDLVIELHNGSIIRLIGLDKADNLVGAGLKGVVFDEYAVLNPTSTDYIEAMLGDTGGWEIIISTPRGENHFFDKYNYAMKNSSEWLADTKHCGMPEIAQYMAKGFLDAKRRELFDKYGNHALYNQEYMTSFTSPNAGSVFGDLVRVAADENRITSIIPLDNVPFYTAWDLGNADSTSIVLFQVDDAGFPTIIDHIENQRESVDWYVGEMEKRKWKVKYHFLPHDAAHHKGAKNETYKQVLQQEGITNTVILKKPKRVSDKLNFLRRLFKHMRINDTCERVVTCLTKLEYEWNDKNKIWSDKPTHKGGYSDTCIGGDSLIETDKGLVPIKDIKLGDRVKVGDNYHKTNSGAFVTGVKETYSLQVGDSSVDITGNHKVLTQRGFVRVDNLVHTDTICYNGNIWKTELNTLHTREKLKQSIKVLSTIIGSDRQLSILLERLAAKKSISIRLFMKSLISPSSARTAIWLTLLSRTGGINQLSSMAVRSGRNIEDITKEMVSRYIVRSGRITSGKYRKGIIYTIKTLTQRTIISVISNFLLLNRTKRNTGESSTKSVPKEGEKIYTKQGSRKVWLTGINQTGSKSFVQKMQRILSPLTSKLFAKFAAKSSLPLKEGLATKIAGSNFTVEKNSGLMEVWNMTIENAHMYSVDGIVMSNCDSVCYMAQAIISHELKGDKSPNFIAHSTSSNTVKKKLNDDELIEALAKFDIGLGGNSRKGRPKLAL